MKKNLQIIFFSKYGYKLVKSRDCGDCDLRSLCDDCTTGAFRCPEGYVYKKED